MAAFTDGARRTRGSVAAAPAPLVHRLLGAEPPVALRCWDGSTLGPAGPAPEGPGGSGRPDDAATTIVVRSPEALRRLLYAPGQLGLSRAYVAGELDLEGDVYELLSLRDRLAQRDPDADLGFGLAGLAEAWRAARVVGAPARPLPRPPEEARPRGRRHSKRRDAGAISHHYDVGNDFYRLVLGETMTYSCGYWRTPGGGDVDSAQRDKHELVGRKLGLGLPAGPEGSRGDESPGKRLLDVGCGWGAMAMHAAEHHGVAPVGVTISPEQADLARRRVAEAGLSDRVEIRLCDYRDVDDGPYDAISSIGMFEHLGLARLGEYFDRLLALVRPEGRVLNHGISPPAGAGGGMGSGPFIDRYVFPDGELHEVGTVVSAMQAAGLEVRDVESLREHYARTLRSWVANLEGGWDEAVAMVGAPRARVWRLYLAASAVNFEAGRTSIHQVLAVRPGVGGASGMAPTRASLVY